MTAPYGRAPYATAPVIVGAGPTGCTLALLLARYGIPSVIIERRTEAFTHPAAHVINARSFEIWHQASPQLASEVAALAPPPDEVSVIEWCTDLQSPPLGHIDLLSAPELVEEVQTHSRFLVSHIGQHRLMPVLWKAVEREPLIELRRGCVVAGLRQRTKGVVVRVDGDDGAGDLTAPLLVGSDGANSTVRSLLGIGMRGPVLAKMGSVFFRAPTLADQPRRPLLRWLYGPAFSGVMIAHADDDYVLMTPYLDGRQAIARRSREYWNRVLPRVLGDGVDYTIHSTRTWTMTSQTAERFADGGVLLAGDAAHRFPHTGGFGLNSGVQDAHNLAWKIAAVIEGRAERSLLDTYETERRPVVRRFADQSTANHFRLDQAVKGMAPDNKSLARATAIFDSPVTRRLPAPVAGPLADMIVRLGVSRSVLLTGDGRAARRRRTVVATRIPDQLEHFASTGLEFGYAYRSPLISSEETPQPLDGDGIVFYLPTTWPGARLPHAWIRHDARVLSTHDVLDPRMPTLFTADPERWRTDTDTPVIALEAADPADSAALIELFEVGEHGAVLVRPDGHVAWRSASDDASAVAGLALFLDHFPVRTMEGSRCR
ncbi:FAD-dependent monooxygenase [Jatrophihabitans fulvus]